METQKRYWVIEIDDASTTTFRRYLPGNLSTKEIITILQRLASRELSPREVIAASVRKSGRAPFLEPRIDGPPHGKRLMVWLPSFPDYKASFWREDELTGYPEISGDG